jgi:hypothetical protein
MTTARRVVFAKKELPAHAVRKKTSGGYGSKKMSQRYMPFAKLSVSLWVSRIDAPKGGARPEWRRGILSGGDSAMVERIKTRWPRLMPEADAAEYVGVSLEQFRIKREKKGFWPKPVDRGCRRNTYDRKDLDDAVDHLKRGNDHPISDIDLDREFGLGGYQDPVSRDAQPR